MKIYKFDKYAYKALKKDYAYILKMTIDGKKLREFENKMIQDDQTSGKKLYEINLAKIICGFYKEKFYPVREDGTIPFVLDYNMQDFKDFAAEVYNIHNHEYFKYLDNELNSKVEKLRDIAKTIVLACKYDGNYEDVKKEFDVELDEKTIKLLEENIKNDKVLNMSIYLDSLQHFYEMTDEELINVDITKYSAKALRSLLLVYQIRIKETQHPGIKEDLEYNLTKLQEYLDYCIKYSSMSATRLIDQDQTKMNETELYVYKKILKEKVGADKTVLDWKEDEKC